MNVEQFRQYAEVRNDYEFEHIERDDDVMLGISIDGWKTADDNEPGQVIAHVLLTKHGDMIVEWHDMDGLRQRRVLEAIEEAKARLKDVWKDARHKKPRLYQFKDDNGDLDLIEVENWDEKFEAAADAAVQNWKASDNEFQNELFGHLEKAGYRIKRLACKTINI